MGTVGSGQNTVRIRISEGVPFSFGFWSGPAGPVSEDPETPGVGARLAGLLPAEGRPGSCPSSCYSNRPSPPGTGAQREEGGCGGTQRGWPAGGGPQGGAGPGRCRPRSVLRPQEGDAIASAFRQHLKLHCLHVTIAWCGRSDDDARAGNQDEPPGTRRRGPVLSKHMLDPEGRERTGALSPRPPAGLGVRRPRRPRPGSPCGPLCCSRDRRAGALSSCASGSHLGKGSDRNRSAADESSTSASGFLQSKLWRIHFR